MKGLLIMVAVAALSAHAVVDASIPDASDSQATESVSLPLTKGQERGTASAPEAGVNIEVHTGTGRPQGLGAASLERRAEDLGEEPQLQDWCLGAIAAVAAGAVSWAVRRRPAGRRRDLEEARFQRDVAERTREGRENQDRLLQGFIGMLFLVQAARNELPDHPDRSAELLDGALKAGDQTVQVERHAIERFVVEENDFDDVAEAIAALGRELLGSARRRPGLEYRVVQEGVPRALRPLIRDEIYRIVRLAVRNAAQFARPSLIEVELDFSFEAFRVFVRDDGQGIESVVDRPTTADTGGAHGRLKALQKRVREHGGRFRAWSRRQAGTEIEFTFLSQRAYNKSLVGFVPWFRRLTAQGWKT